MKLIDWNCKGCGNPMPDKSPYKIGEHYIFCPKCGAKHMVDPEYGLMSGTTHVEVTPWPRWVEVTTMQPCIQAWDNQTITAVENVTD